MKLEVNFDGLWAKVHEMGAGKITTAAFENHWSMPEVTINKELFLDDVSSQQGLLSIDDSQVLLYIPDQGSNILNAMETPGKGKKFHVAECKTIRSMRAKNKTDRFIATNDLSSSFTVYGENEKGQNVTGIAMLHVCQNCLKYLNYQNASFASTYECYTLARDFSIRDFFGTHSTLFAAMPKGIASTGKGYTENWDTLSRRLRKKAGFTCSKCHVMLSDYQHLLHVHHINGVKHDNVASNLKVLCADCHRKEPDHGHMCLNHQGTQHINRLRHEQGIILADREDWQQAFKFADPALHGILEHAQKHESFKDKPPVVGYMLNNGNNPLDTIYVDLAWPKKRWGICITPPQHTSDWRLRTVKEAWDFFSKDSKNQK